MMSPRTLMRKEASEQAASSLKDHLDRSIREAIKIELSQLGASIAMELAENKTSIMDALAESRRTKEVKKGSQPARETKDILRYEFEHLKSSILVELALNRGHIIKELNGMPSKQKVRCASADSAPSRVSRNKIPRKSPRSQIPPKSPRSPRRTRAPSKESKDRSMSRERPASKEMPGHTDGTMSGLGFGRQVSPFSGRTGRRRRTSQLDFSRRTSPLDFRRRISPLDFGRSTSPFGKANDNLPLLDESAATSVEEPAEQHNRSSASANRLARFVGSHAFETIAASVVFFSVIWLTFQVQYNAITWTADSPGAFIWVEVSFSILFSLELCLRMVVAGCREFFSGEQSVANIFDTVIVTLQVFDTSAQLVGMNDKKTPLVSVFRVLRLFRIVRLVRLFRFFPDLRMLLVSALKAIQPLVWVFALILCITGSFAIVITSAVNEYKAQFTAEEFEEEEKKYADDIMMVMMHRNLLEFFGGVDRSALSLYGAISGGRDWQTSVGPLATFVNPNLNYVFVCYTFFVVFSMMNIITSQCVNTALEASAKDRIENMVGNLMDVFSTPDSDELVTEETFMRHLHDSSMKSFLKDLYKREDVTAEEIKDSRLFEMLDYDGSGALTKEELMLGCIKLTGSATSLDLAVLKMDVLEIRSDVARLLQEISSKTSLIAAVQGS